MNKRILAIAVPSILANITTPLLGLVDTAIVGHMGSAVFIGAIAVGGVMFNMLYWLFSFLRGGTSGLAAQAYGAADTRTQALVLYRSLLVALGIGAAMIVLQWPLEWILSHFVDPDADTAAERGHGLVEGVEHGVVAASGTPAHGLVALILLCCVRHYK